MISAASSYSRVAVNAISNLAGFVIRGIIAFFLLRYTVSELGSEQYSVIPLVTSLMSYLLLLSMGTGMGMARYITAANTRGHHEEVSRIFSSMFTVLVGIATILLTAGLIFATQISELLKIPPGLETAAALLMGITVVSSAIRMPFSVLQSAFVATESYWLMNSIAVGSTVLQAILVIALLSSISKWVVWIALAQLIVSLLTTVTEWIAARRILPSMRIKLSLFDAKLTLQVMSFSFAVFIGSVSGILYWDTNKIIINQWLSPTDLTIYAIVVTTAMTLYQVMNVPLNVLFPVVAKAEATNNKKIVREMICRGTRLSVLFSLPCWVLFALLADPFFHWYLGSEYQDVSTFAPFIAATMFLSSATSIIRLIPVPMGQPRFISMSELAFGMVNIIITIMLVVWLDWGLVGVVYGTLVAVGIKNIILLPWYVARLVDLSLNVLLRDIFCAIVPTIVAGLFIFGLHNIFGVSWIAPFSIPASITLLIFFVSAYFIGLPMPERKRVRSSITNALKSIR